MHNVSSGPPPLAYANEIIVGYDEPTRDTQYVHKWSSPAHSDTNDRTPCPRTCFFAIVPVTVPPAKTSSEISDPNNGSSIPNTTKFRYTYCHPDSSFGLPLKKYRLYDFISIPLTFFTDLSVDFSSTRVNRVRRLEFLFSKPPLRVLLYVQFTVPKFNTSLDSLWLDSE